MTSWPLPAKSILKTLSSRIAIPKTRPLSVTTIIGLREKPTRLKIQNLSHYFVKKLTDDYNSSNHQEPGYEKNKRQ